VTLCYLLTGVDLVGVLPVGVVTGRVGGIPGLGVPAGLVYGNVFGAGFLTLGGIGDMFYLLS